MTLPASLEGHEQARLFLGLPLPFDAVGRLVHWQQEHLRDVRIVEPAHLHVTLAFLGSTPVARFAAIADALAAAADGRGRRC